MNALKTRWRHAFRWATSHLAVSATVALVAAGLVFGIWYPNPYREVLAVGPIFLLLLVVDVVCGPILTFILASPTKSRKESILDLSLIAVVQIAALIYGMNAVWSARPVVLAFESDRFTVVSANELDHSELRKAPPGFDKLPFAGVLQVATRRPSSNAELFAGVEMSLAGLGPALRPAWWVPIGQKHEEMRAMAKPLKELIERRPDHAKALRDAAKSTGMAEMDLLYLPLTSSKTKDWIALLDASLNIVGFSPVDGF